MHRQATHSFSPSVKARLAGLFFLLYVATGATGYFISQSLIVRDDATATAANILANETVFRLAIAANLVAAAAYLVVAVLLYDLFRPVDRSVARLAVLFLIMSCVLGAFDSLFHLAAIDMLRGRYFSVFGAAERQALAYLFLQENIRALDMGLIFFGFLWIVLGYLILRSTFLPRTLGVIAVFDGFWYLTHLYRPLAAALLPYVMTVPGLGSIIIILWLTIKGVDARSWKEQADAALASSRSAAGGAQ